MASTPRLLAAALLACGGLLRPALAGDQLGEALQLVMSAHPELIARQSEYESVRGTSRWSSDLRLSLSEGQSEYGAAGGGRAVVSLTIPLTGGPHAENKARAQRELESARDTVRSGFLADVTSLRETARQRVHREERRDFWRDQVEYHRQAVEEGLLEPDRLWTHAERLQTAEHDYRAAAHQLEVDLDRIARRYGGQQWEQLRHLLAGIASCNPDSPPSARAPTC